MKHVPWKDLPPGSGVGVVAGVLVGVGVAVAGGAVGVPGPEVGVAVPGVPDGVGVGSRPVNSSAAHPKKIKGERDKNKIACNFQVFIRQNTSLIDSILLRILQVWQLP